MQFTGSSCAVHSKFTGSSYETSQEVHAQAKKASNIKVLPGVKQRSNFTLKYNNLNNNLNYDDYYYYLKSLKQTKHGNSNPVSVKEIYASCEVHRKGSVQSVGELITVDEAATMLDKSRRMVFEYIKTGKLEKVEKVVNGRKRTMVPLAMCEALCEELGISQETSQEEVDTSQEVSQEEETASYEIIEPSQETSQETRYLVDVWAEVDRRITQAVEPYRQQVDMLTAQNKVLLERLKNTENRLDAVEKEQTKWVTFTPEDVQKMKERVNKKPGKLARWLGLG